MSLGQWLGRWAGAWFGDAGETDPNAASAAAVITVGGTGSLGGIGWISASATIAVNGSGRLTAGGVVIPFPSGGGRGFLPERRKRRDTDDDVLIAILLS